MLSWYSMDATACYDEIITFTYLRFRSARMRFDLVSAKEMHALARLAGAALDACTLREDLQSSDSKLAAKAADRAPEMAEAQAEYLRAVGM